MPTRTAVDGLRQLAEGRHRDPALVLSQATGLLADTDDPSVEATLWWVMGLALQELSRPREAVASFRRSLAIDAGTAIADCRALTRASLAISLLSVGDTTGADREVTQARATAPSSVRWVVEMLHGLVLQRTGRLDAALAAYRRALPALVAAGDLPCVARLLLNRGALHAYQGDLDAALDDLVEAERISAENDLPILAAMAAHNSAFAYGRRGDLPDALAAFDRAERAYAMLNNPRYQVAVLQADRCEVLLLAGLATEARQAAAAAVEALELTGDMAHRTECRLLLARALLAEASYDEAIAQATLAARHFQAARRLPWAAQARYVALQAEALVSEDHQVPPPDLLRRSRRIAVELEQQGWPVEALHVRTFVGRLALALGRPAIARAELAQAAGARARGTADLRAQAWHATALLRVADGDVAGAKRALVRGMGVVDEYRASLGATELRAHAAGHGADLARLGLRLALDGGRPTEVFRWAERWRAGALRQPAVRPPDDEELAAALAELRAIRSELREAALAGTVPAALYDRAAALEEAVRRRTRQTRDDRPSDTGRIDVRAVHQALGDRVLVEYVAFEGRLHAVTVARGRVRARELGATGEVEQEKRYLLFAHRRLMASRSRLAAEATMASTALRLDDLLLAPLGLPDDAPIVVVPTGALHGLPWAALPSLAGRPTTIAPSAAIWLGGGARSAGPAERGAGPDPRLARVALVAGPHLPGAEAEVLQLAELYPDATVLTGAEATATNALEALGRADLVHLAAHGTFRGDSPLFSCVLLEDGPLTVYDLERLRAVPAVVVLPACDAAAAAVRTGDELLGTASALLGLGVSTVIAPVLAVPDETTAAMMVALHHRLRAGEPPAAALAHAAAGQDPAAAVAFVCIGRNDVLAGAAGGADP